MLTFGSLFAGIGGFDLGLERAGMVCKWQVEIDDYCQRVLAKHWPDVRRHRDVRECGERNLEKVDVICGGFPCQDISQAGKQEGIEGARSGLWSEYYRIICELRPRYVIVENVAALLIRGMGRVLGDLAEGGYDAEWDCIPAYYCGSPQTRDRVFIVAHIGVSRTEGNGGRDWTRRRFRRTSKDGQNGWPEITASNVQSIIESSMGGAVNGIPSKLDADRIFGLGNAVVPQVAEWLGRQIVAAEARGLA